MIIGFLSIVSCDVFELDNYDAPSVSLSGVVIDSNTGDTIRTDQGNEGIRVRLTELSWGDNVEHNPDFFCRPDGTFQNTKLFEGDYNIRIDGPFIPLVRTTEEGDTLVDETKYMTLKGTGNEVVFDVEPFLNVEWVEKPKATKDGKVSARIRINKGMSNEEFRGKIEPMGNYDPDFYNITDVRLFVSYSSSVGYRARDERWSATINYEGNDFDDKLDQIIEIESEGKIPEGRVVFVRAAARINYATPHGSGIRRWNYNKAERVEIP